MKTMITFESIHGVVTVPLTEATFEQLLTVRDQCNDLLTSLDLEALNIA